MHKTFREIFKEFRLELGQSHPGLVINLSAGFGSPFGSSLHLSILSWETTRDQSSVYSMIGTTGGTQIVPSNATILFSIVSWDMAAVSCMREKCRRQAKYVRTRHRFDLRSRDITRMTEIFYIHRRAILQNVTMLVRKITGESKYQISVF